MTSLHDVVETEIYKAPTGLYEDTAQQYAGWWYCVIPTATIEREGLPLPYLFVLMMLSMRFVANPSSCP